jgi:hypothetical protein
MSRGRGQSTATAIARRKPAKDPYMLWGKSATSHNRLTSTFATVPYANGDHSHYFHAGIIAGFRPVTTVQHARDCLRCLAPLPGTDRRSSGCGAVRLPRQRAAGGQRGHTAPPRRSGCASASLSGPVSQLATLRRSNEMVAQALQTLTTAGEQQHA